MPPSVTASPTHHHNPASMADSVIWSAGSSPPLPENKTVEAGESKLMPCPKKKKSKLMLTDLDLHLHLCHDINSTIPIRIQSKESKFSITKTALLRQQCMEITSHKQHYRNCMTEIKSFQLVQVYKTALLHESISACSSLQALH